MIRTFVFVIANLLGSSAALAAGDAAVPLKHIEVDFHDKAALYRGAETFLARCATCHNAEYMRYGRVASDLKLSDKQLAALLPPGTKPGSEMMGFMPTEYGKSVFGVVPPDLSLIARVKGADWLYTYLTSFYADPTKRWGVNNAVFPGVGMPDVFAAEQGVLQPVYTDVKLPDGSVEKRLAHLEGPPVPGSMSPAEFDRMVKDLVSFMVYMSEPAKMQRMTYGPYVLAFILLFTLLMYFLKKEYWRDIKKVPDSQ